MARRRRRARHLMLARSGRTEQLVEAAHNRDEDALVELIRRCERLIAAGLAAAGLSPNEPLYPDAQNQALFTIWERFDTFRGEAEPCPWMYRVARRSAASRTIDPEVRERRRRERHLIMMNASDLVARSGEDDVVDADLLEEVLRRLEPDSREIIVLRVIQELSTADTAELLFLSESGVKSRLLRARKEAASIARQLQEAE